MKTLKEQFPDATKKEPVIKKYYPPDDKEFTRIFRREMGYIALGVLVATILSIWAFCAIIYGPIIDKTLPH